MVNSHSKNKLIIKSVAALNKAHRYHAVHAILSTFKVKSKAQFISNCIANKIFVPDCYHSKTGNSKQTALNYWKAKYNFYISYYGEVNFKYTRPSFIKGYGAILAAAAKLGTFTWSQLLNSIPYYAQRINKSYNNWLNNSSGKHVTYNQYSNNYYNSYRAYFVRNCIIARIKGTNKYQLTTNGKQLIAGMQQLPSMQY